jgi:hypothetical protein
MSAKVQLFFEMFQIGFAKIKNNFFSAINVGV